jgi:DNA-binding transcriptional regulator GbsR (MarR family)
MKRLANKGAKVGNPDAEKVARWVERVAVFWSEQSGLPPITGRIVGWLMVCDTPEQSAGEIAAAIGASRASLTTSIRLLLAIGLVHSVTRPGQRTIYYRIDGDAWETVLRRRIASMASFRAITREGLTLLGENKSRAARIQAADEVYAWAERVFANAPPCPSTKPKTGS